LIQALRRTKYCVVWLLLLQWWAKTKKGEVCMSILGWIFFGLVVGVIGKLLMPGRDPGGFVITILLGIAGALVGGFLGRMLGLYREDDPVGFVMAVIGSIVLLVLYRVLAGRRA
jgi:uncharacterized membrane protein YeaQ/YmgE (transglycosylase-associated protein family)